MQDNGHKKMGMRLARPLLIAVMLLILWQLTVIVTGAPSYILPGPVSVLRQIAEQGPLLARNAVVTASEILAGLVLGVILGGMSAIFLSIFRPARRWLMPLLVISQALPVFALAPLLTLWLGYGMASKIAMATLIIYFPVTSAFYDGLRRTDLGWLDLARSMGARRLAVLQLIRIPAAMPGFASGLRVAAAVAPIGAVVGEWVGAGAGLGYLMLHANARMQVDLMFAALFVLAAIALAVFYLVDALMTRLLFWKPDAGAE